MVIHMIEQLSYSMALRREIVKMRQNSWDVLLSGFVL
jgi:hypothetical protein